MKFIHRLLAIVLLFSAALFNTQPSTSYAADFTATIDINYNTLTKMELGMRGVNNENTGSAMIYNDDDYVSQVNGYDRLGYVRFPGGTNINVFNWKTGAVDEEYLAQYSKGQDHYYNYMDGKRKAETKGFERIGDYRDFLQKTGTKAMINVNVFQHTPDEIGDLAKYLYDNHVPVIYFELGNEVAFYTAEVGNSNPQYITGTDYANRMKAYNDAIKANYPGAKTVVSLSNHQWDAYDSDLFNYPDKFWDGMTTHRFKGNGATFAESIKSANTALADWQTYLNHYPTDKPLYVGEYGPTLNGEMAQTQYHGIYVAESALRMTKHPSISIIGGFRLTNGIFKPADNHTKEMEDAYQRGLSLDTTTFNYNPYYAAPSVSLRVVDGAINKSSAYWTTTVTGGAAVEKANGTTMPALYAQAYRGDDGKTYMVITNKSDKSHEVTIKVNGGNVTKALTKHYVSNLDPAAKNSDTVTSTLSVQSEPTANPVYVPAYSVMRIEWERAAAPLAPKAPWLSHADVSGSQVSLKWHRQFTATDYAIKYGTVPGIYTQTINVGNVNSHTITGLSNGTTYYFAVTAKNSSGESGLSNEITAVLSRPAAPMITDTNPERSGRVAVEWRSVPGATGYKLKYGTTPGIYTATVDVGNNVGHILQGLTNNQPYYFTVAAYNGFGESGNSAEQAETPVSGLPLAPYGLTITAQSSTDVTLSWARSKVETHRYYFESGNANNWNPALGSWNVVTHPDPSRATYVYQSPVTSRAISVYQPVTGDYEADAGIEVASYNANAQVGLVARYIDNNNYYRFVYNAAQDDFRIVRVLNGTEQVLSSITRSQLQTDEDITLDTAAMTMRFNVNGSTLEGKINSLGAILSATDSSHASGSFGVYSNNQQANFDGIRIRRDVAETFKIYRSTDPVSGFGLVGQVTGTTFYDSGLADAQEYYYRVTSVNSKGESYGHSNTYKKN
jgi:fibronectin type 3 domain-containing protein